MRENEASVKRRFMACQDLLGEARQNLTILDPEVGEEELIKAVEAALARLRALSHFV